MSFNVPPKPVCFCDRAGALLGGCRYPAQPSCPGTPHRGTSTPGEKNKCKHTQNITSSHCPWSLFFFSRKEKKPHILHSWYKNKNKINRGGGGNLQQQELRISLQGLQQEISLGSVSISLRGHPEPPTQTATPVIPSLPPTP